MPKSNNAKSHRCELCFKLFQNVANLKKHIRNVHKEKTPTKCNLCDKLFKRKQNLKSKQEQRFIIHEQGNPIFNKKEIVIQCQTERERRRLV